MNFTTYFIEGFNRSLQYEIFSDLGLAGLRGLLTPDAAGQHVPNCRCVP